MNMTEYQQLALRTEKPLDGKWRLAHGAMGVANEAGEINDIIKAHIIYGKELDVDHMVKELGDMMWFVAQIATVIGVSLNHVASANIDKLRRRYPTGYSDQAAIARSDEPQPPRSESFLTEGGPT